MELRDEAIIRNCLAGDKEAFSLLVDRYKKPVFVFIYRMVQQREEADDLAQETFIRAYTNLWRYNSAYKFSTWLFQIAKNLCIDSLRRRPVLLPEPEAEGRTAAPVTPEGEVLREEMRCELAAAVAGLPPQQKACIILYHYDGLSYQETAEQLGLPLQTVKNSLFRAREKLRRTIKSEGGLAL
ncbi:MAG: RNA polymerase sigma factor [bacterium]|jgi:RNA polymerase sigma factor (sigma-70 family)